MSLVQREDSEKKRKGKRRNETVEKGRKKRDVEHEWKKEKQGESGGKEK